MSKLLQQLDLAPPEQGEPRLSGLVSVNGGNQTPQSTEERVACHEARLLEGTDETKKVPIDYIFFRRFTDGRSPQVAAYIVDNNDNRYSEDKVAELHHRVWLNGKAPLLYVEWPTKVDVLKCAAGPVFLNKTNNSTYYNPSETLDATSVLFQELEEEKRNKFSAYRLSDGTFWEDPKNKKWACADKTAHQSLIQAIKEADEDLGGEINAPMRDLLLLFILIKYLEDRKVFPKNWFEENFNGSTCFLNILSSGNTDAVKNLLAKLKERFNGDIFKINFSLTSNDLKRFAHLFEADTLARQRYLWKLFNFNYIPVEVLSHVYQHFAQQKDGAVFTPPLVVDLMLDFAMPYDKIKGDETIFDPTCGSGIFLVGAFRRLVHSWRDKHDWERPDVPQLKNILIKAIFGAELREQAAHVAVFNLVLAICDALQPKIIWENLQFDKILGTNVFIGDVFENLDEIRKVSNGGFSIIVGNPPFISKLTPAARETRNPKNTIPIPDNQLSYRVIEEAMELLSLDGRICFIQPHGFLYNAKPKKFFEDWLTKNTIKNILDFVSIPDLFEDAEAKAVAIHAMPGTPDENNVINHFTFRRTKSLRDRIAFELDHYDKHLVHQQLAETFSLVWKANLLGGGRLKHISEEITTLPTLAYFLKEKDWQHGEGFNLGNQTQSVDFINTNDDFVEPDALGEDGINWEMVHKCPYSKFESPRKIDTYTPPMVLIRETDTMPMAFVKDRKLVFSKQIMSINAPVSEADQLKEFADAFGKFKMEKTTKAICLLHSSRALVGMNSSILKNDICKLPWSREGKSLNFSFWEKTLLNEVMDYMADLVRKGPNSTVLANDATPKIISKYADLFVRMLGSVYRNLKVGPSNESNSLVYQSFYFGKEGREVVWPENWDEKITTIIHKDNGSYRTNRIIHCFDGDKLIIIKPKLLRYWIQSTAIWDADEVLAYMYSKGY